MGVALRASVLFLVAAAACADTNNLSGGLDTFDDDAGGPTKPKDSGSTPIGDDGGPVVPGGRCDGTKPWGPPELITAFDPQASATKSGVLTPDELEAFYLMYVGSATWELRHARRPTKDAAWGSVATDAMTPSPQGFLSLTAAGKKLYYWLIGKNYRAGRASSSETFGTPATYTAPDAPWSFVVEADDTVYFAKYAEGGGERFIYRASLDNSGHNAGTVVPNVHVAGANDSRAVLNASETTMYFASNRPGGRGLDDVWVARRTTKQDEFGPGTHVRELSSDDPDYVTWVSDDDCVVLLDRASHVYQSKRPQ